jgi:hypothetical protein
MWRCGSCGRSGTWVTTYVYLEVQLLVAIPVVLEHLICHLLHCILAISVVQNSAPDTPPPFRLRGPGSKQLEARNYSMISSSLIVPPPSLSLIMNSIRLKSLFGSHLSPSSFAFSMEQGTEASTGGRKRRQHAPGLVPSASHVKLHKVFPIDHPIAVLVHLPNHIFHFRSPIVRLPFGLVSCTTMSTFQNANRTRRAWMNTKDVKLLRDLVTVNLPIVFPVQTLKHLRSEQPHSDDSAEDRLRVHSSV